LNNQDFATQLLTNKLKTGIPNVSPGTRAQIPSHPNKGLKESFQLQVAETEADDIEVTDKGLRCDCDIEDGGDCCFCEDCGYWYHIWCMGYHSAKDKSLPKRFVCFNCRARMDRSGDLIKGRSNFKELVFFRRALKIFEEDEPEDVSSFAEHFRCDDEAAERLFQRLEAEGFIEDEPSGLMKLRPHHSKKGKTRHSQRSGFRFVAASKESVKYNDYFNPDPIIERRLLALDFPRKLRDDEMKVDVLPTYEAGDFQRPASQGRKRKTRDSGHRNAKKTKLKESATPVSALMSPRNRFYENDSC